MPPRAGSKVYYDLLPESFGDQSGQGGGQNSNQNNQSTSSGNLVKIQLMIILNGEIIINYLIMKEID